MKILQSLLVIATTMIVAQAAAPRLDVPVVGPNRNVQLTVRGDAGAEYSIEWSLNLSSWSLVGQGIAANGALTLNHDASAYSTIFYRAKGAGVSEPLAVYPAELSLNVGGEGVLLPNQPREQLQWTSSDPAIVSIVTNGLVKAVAKGVVSITASAGAERTTTTVTVYDPIAGDRSTTDRIRQALANSTITAEQELIYRTYAAFGDQRLPAQFRGAPDETHDRKLMNDLRSKIDTLSPGAQQILRPFLLPPIYADSWYSQRLGLTATGGGGGSGTNTPCASAVLRDDYPRLSTAHFNIYYARNRFNRFDPFEASSAEIQRIVAAVVEQVYQAETSLLGRFPLSDLNEGCNGGDGAVDIYIIGFDAGGPQALTVPYHVGCNGTASFILLNRESPLLSFAGAMGSAANSEAPVKAVLAHEFMHVLQYAMQRNADCADFDWFDEATAEWAMDFVDRSFNEEDGQDVYPFKQRSGGFLARYLLSEHNSSIEKPGVGINGDKNGYADYLFFQFLARKYGDATIKQIYNATAGGMRSVEAIQSGLGSRGGFKQVWPEFARTLWIDTKGGPLNYWVAEDQYDFGLQFLFTTAEPFKERIPSHLRTIEVDQKGAPNARFKLLQGAAVFEGGYEIPARSLFYEHLNFTDDNVRSVLFVNPFGGAPPAYLEFIKLYAYTKIGGQWKGPEDWTNEHYKEFCRDKKDERLEELLIIVSNSDPNRPNPEHPFSLDDEYPMQVSTSNVGCWQWEGSASVLYQNDTTTQLASAVQLKYEVKTNIPGRLYFETTAGSATGSSHTDAGGCTLTSTAGQRVIVKRDSPDGLLDYNLDLDMGDGRGSNRDIVTLFGATVIGTQNKIECPNFNQTGTADQSWIWLQRPTPTNIFTVSADGQTIEANVSEPHPAGGFTKVIFKFTSKRE
jgi:hypothetical protein